MATETPERLASLLSPIFRLGEFTWLDTQVDGYTIPDEPRIRSLIEALQAEMLRDPNSREVSSGRIRMVRNEDTGALSVSLELGELSGDCV